MYNTQTEKSAIVVVVLHRKAVVVMLLSSNSDGSSGGATRLSSGGSTGAGSFKGSIKAIKRFIFGKSTNDDSLLKAITKCCSDKRGLPKQKHLRKILNQMHSNTDDGATPDKITLFISTIKWNNNNIITNRLLSTLLILQHHCPSRVLCRYNEAMHFLQAMIQDSDDKTINSLNRQYALLLLQKIRFHNSNGTILSRFFTTIPTTITSIIIDIDYNISISSNELLLIISMLLTCQNEVIKLMTIIFGIKDVSSNEIYTYHSSLQPIIEESFCIMIALSNLIKKLTNKEDKNKTITMSYVNQYNDQLQNLRGLYVKANDIEFLKQNQSIPSALPELCPLV